MGWGEEETGLCCSFSQIMLSALTPRTRFRDKTRRHFKWCRYFLTSGSYTAQ